MIKYIKTFIKKNIVILKLRNIGLLVFILALFSNCSDKKEKLYTETVDELFDTTHILTGYAQSEEEFKKNVSVYEKEMKRFDKLYTIYKSYDGINNLKTINDNAGIKAIKVDKDIINLLEESIRMYREVSNSVNIAAGSIIDLWEKRNENTLPLEEKLKEASKCTDINNIVINKKEETVFLKEKCMKINVGAVAKGYAVEFVAEKMKKMGITSFIISAGGNVRIIGKRKVPKKENKISDLKKCREEFCIGITSPIYGNTELDNNNPYKKGEYIAKIAAKDMSVVTTGNYQRYFVYKGEIYGHVIDLKKLKPGGEFASVTVITENSAFADFMSTALFLLSYEEGEKLVKNMGNIDAIWAFKNGEIKNTERLINGENYVKYNFKE
ncbi:FAD:protein FMN transferase [Leptotrichia sp. OH3620_COT-345]|uniref:FAD:protein FMN transferase n=1 Tax=Leptotrichia sp. OH3620_COT-345 TaxID=2491048 RepID=UPI000F64C301|nr:FAD:protein FMN transferase [Leptotrichia sp. OH3620_COT-345]RRD41050.1 FAD:protein FMN transferase [Leptotrichia sp. OH3620_COT-345]